MIGENEKERINGISSCIALIETEWRMKKQTKKKNYAAIREENTFFFSFSKTDKRLVKNYERASARVGLDEFSKHTPH